MVLEITQDIGRNLRITPGTLAALQEMEEMYMAVVHFFEDVQWAVLQAKPIPINIHDLAFVSWWRIKDGTYPTVRLCINKFASTFAFASTSTSSIP